MVAFPRFPSHYSVVNPLVPPVGGAVAGVCVGALFALVPAATLEDWVWASGLPALVAAAAPPLGTTARAVLALAGGGMTASVVWSLLYLLVGPGGLLRPRTPATAVPVVRRADAHRDAPPRRPMTAADLGTPLMEVKASAPPPAVEQTVPADLNQPLAAFDPLAIPEQPLPAPARVAPLSRQPIIAAAPAPLAPGERIDTFVLAPPPPAPATPRPTIALPVPIAKAPPRTVVIPEKPSIEAMLRRLEEVAAQRLALGG